MCNHNPDCKVCVALERYKRMIENAKRIKEEKEKCNDFSPK